MSHHNPDEMAVENVMDEVDAMPSHAHCCVRLITANKSVTTGTTIGKITHQGEIDWSWWVYCMINNNQKAMMNAIPTNCKRDNTVLAAEPAVSTSKAIKSAHAPMAKAIKEK